MKVFKAHYNRCLPLLVTVALVLTSINLPNDVLNIEAKTDEQEVMFLMDLVIL